MQRSCLGLESSVERTRIRLHEAEGDRCKLSEPITLCFWIEYAADYHSDRPRELDSKKVPNDTEQVRFLRACVSAVMVMKARKLDLQLLPCYVLSEDIGLVDQWQPDNVASQGRKGEVSSQAKGGARRLLHCCSMWGRGIDQVVPDLQAAAVEYMSTSHLPWGLWGCPSSNIIDMPAAAECIPCREIAATWAVGAISCRASGDPASPDFKPGKPSRALSHVT